MPSLAIDGGSPVRARLLPYGRQSIDAADREAVVAALTSDWLTTGPRVADFEAALAVGLGSAEAVAISNGTAALHAAYHALGVGPDDEVIVPALTFAATANAAAYLGATPVFADIDPDTLLIDPASVERRVTTRTRVVTGVDYAGQPADYPRLRALAESRGLHVAADACHAIGGHLDGVPVGRLADVSTFSFHPVKHITTGEGGAITTQDAELARAMRVFRNHGITSDHRQREAAGGWAYDMVALGYNYRLSDLQCALGLSQLAHLAEWVARRREIASAYDAAFAGRPDLRPQVVRPGAHHAYHLYVVQLTLERLRVDRGGVFRALRAEGVGVNVHYVPVHLHPYYRNTYGTGPGLCPAAEAAYERILSLPIFPGMTEADVADVVAAVNKVLEAYTR